MYVQTVRRRASCVADTPGGGSVDQTSDPVLQCRRVRRCRAAVEAELVLCIVTRWRHSGGRRSQVAGVPATARRCAVSASVAAEVSG